MASIITPAKRGLPLFYGFRAGVRQCQLCNCRSSSTAPADSQLNEDMADLDSDSSLNVPPPSEEVVKSYDPLALSKSRKVELPSSRFRFRPPRHYRGPLHPHQPPPPSDPSSRLFIPGPFSIPRLEQTYDSTIAADLMTLMYTHQPPGEERPPPTDRLRRWEGDSPYFKNRPIRKPRGGHLRLMRRPITFRNIPKVTGVTVHSMAKDASEDSAYLHAAGMAVQAITNVRVTTHKAKTSVQQWGLRAGKFCSVTATLKGEDMYHFLSKCVDLVLPRVKDWKGINSSSGDANGNITFGLTSEAVGLFPEIEVNYDMYPPKMIPGCHITIHTSATNDRDARLLVNALGFPFNGSLVK